jgi:Mg2+/Co2+ transporter CorB
MVEASIELTKEVLLKLSEDQFSRLPVYCEDRDNVVRSPVTVCTLRRGLRLRLLFESLGSRGHS